MKDGCCRSGMALMIVRVALGVIMFLHGAHKVLGWPMAPGLGGPGGLANTVAGMSQMFPVAVVYLICAAEFLGGLGLIVGLFSRLAAFGVLAVMSGAIYFVHLKNGFFLNFYMVPNVGHGFEFNFALAAMALAVLVGGSGCCALDNMRGAKKSVAGACAALLALMLALPAHATKDVAPVTIQPPAAVQPTTVQTVIAVKGMTCNSCEKKVSKSLMSLPGVQSVDASAKQGKVQIAYNPQQVTMDQLRAAITNAGFVPQAQ